MEGIIEIQTTVFKGIAVEVPEGSHNFSTSVDYQGKYLNFFIGEYDEDGDDVGGELTITEDSTMRLKLIGVATEITEAQAAVIVTSFIKRVYIPQRHQGYRDENQYLNYLSSLKFEDSFSTALGSLASLMQSVGCAPDKVYVILRRIEG